MADSGGVQLNTDDHTVLEFAFARNMAPGSRFRINALRTNAKAIQADHLQVLDGEHNIDWSVLQHERLSMLLGFGETPDPKEFGEDSVSLAAAYTKFNDGQLADALALWRERPRETTTPNDL